MVKAVKQKEPECLSLRDDSVFPNSVYPVLLYRQVVDNTEDLAPFFEQRFAANNWMGAWRGGVYPFPHYHSTSHEVLAVYRGAATLQLGGPTRGSCVKVQAGDVLVIPAGVSHQDFKATDDFGVVGAYPDGRRWDLLRGFPGDRPEADHNISEVPLPGYDPLYGSAGPLRELWQ